MRRYRRTESCNSDANSTQARLIARLRDQRALTQTADGVGEKVKVDGSDGVNGRRMKESSELVLSW
jgi:hypothetical protein